MRILELQQYAKDNGFDSVKFEFTTPFGKTLYGKWIDAYFGIFRIEGMKKNAFTNVYEWRREFGDELIEFKIVDNE